MKTIHESKEDIKLKILRIAIALNDKGLRLDDESYFIDDLLDATLYLGNMNSDEIGKPTYTEELSDCCMAGITEGGLCKKCGEHCGNVKQVRNLPF